jgi:hypothetical protein
MTAEPDTMTPPDERAFQAYVEGARFQSGVDRGEWRLVTVDWPHVVIAVSAAARPNGPSEFALQFDLAGYPVDAPPAAPWDLERDQPLDPDRWPKGDRVGRAFNPNWNPNALYIPCDRAAIRDHGHWLTQYRRYVWDATRDITFYLRLVHELVHDADYQGV